MRKSAMLVVLCAGAMAPAGALADSFTPVQMTVTVNAVARLDKPLPVRVQVSADAGVLDIRQGLIRAQVRLTPQECGGSFQFSPGSVLLNAPLTPQPSVGDPYAAAVRGAARPHGYGLQNVCAYLEDDSGQQFANDTNDLQVYVSKPCTEDADRYDRANAVLARDRRRLHRAHGKSARERLTRQVKKDRSAAAKYGHQARMACGSGVQL